ncbi:hypothetical protein MMC31_004905 [Peltigera leucophlebia]|nr:hypothetical protein [Peltigera leucophlebia]
MEPDTLVTKNQVQIRTHLSHDGSVGRRALPISSADLGLTSDMTAEKARDMLLEDERRQAEKNGDKASNATALAHRNSDHRGQEAGGCRHCHKPGHKEDSCWRKHPEFMPAWAKLKRESESTPNESTSPSKPATMLKNEDALKTEPGLKE